MKKKKVILSLKQINEIGLPMTEPTDFAEKGATEVFTGDFMDNEYAEPLTTNDIAKSRTNDIGGLWKNGGASRNVAMMESIFDQLKQFLNEENNDLEGRKTTFSPTAIKNIGNAPSDSVAANAIKNGINQERLPDIMHDFEGAMAETENGDSSKLNRMGGINAYNEFKKVYDKAKSDSKMRRDAKPEGSKIKSAPKESGNGKAHSKKNEPIITYTD